MKNNFGTVTFEGKDYTLTEFAQAENYGEHGVRFYALAKDSEGIEYRVTWEPLPNWDAFHDEDSSCACDWDNPISVEPIE